MDRSGWSMVWLIPARMFYIDNNRVSDVDQWCDVPMSFKLSKKRGMWCLKRILSLTGREVMRERERQCMWYWTRWERGMREGWEMREREIGQDSSEAKAGWVKEKWNVFFFFVFFFVEKRERERVCVCVCLCVCMCVWSEVWLVMICSGPLYLIFFFDFWLFFNLFDFFFSLFLFSLWIMKRHMNEEAYD